MKIRSIRTFTGPNLFHHSPILLMTLELRELTEVASTDVPFFTERLIDVLPGLREHHCSPGHAGGFIERLRTGTYFAHITEHIALELSELAGIGVHYGKTVYGGEEGVYQVAVRYKCEHAMKYILETAVELVSAVVEGKGFPINEKITEAKKIVSRYSLGASTLSLIEAAEARGIPWSRMNDESLIQLGYGKNRKFIEATTTGETSDIAVRIAQDKNFAKKILADASLPVPRGILVSSEADAIEAFAELGTAVAMKPHDGHHGNGVCLGIKSIEDVRRAWRIASEYSRDVIIEELFHGQDYRVLVVGGKTVAASHRIPAHVIGNGKDTLRKLIEEENKNPLRGEGHEKAMTLIEVDEASMALMTKQNLTLDSVPDAARVVQLKDTANLSTGGCAIDVTDEIHPDIADMCERAARIIGLDVCGIDLIFEDISRSWLEQTGGIIEVNAGPGIRMHLYPSHGKERNVARDVIEQLYPKNRPSRIPIVSVTGTNGKTTVSRLITHIFSGLDLTVGNTTTDGIFIGKKQIARGDTTGPASAKVVLNDPCVDVAVLETARGGIMRRGLGYDWSDVGIITNVQADHIGQDGIEDLDDILRVKSLVAERVREGGFIILNADSEPLQALIQEKNLTKGGRKLVLFSRNQDSTLIRRHVDAGNRAYVEHDGAIYELHGTKETFLINTHEIPLTVGGTAGFQIENVLAALAAADVMEVPVRDSLDGLRSFHHAANSGRTNLYQVGKGFVLIDYGHNPEAIRSVGNMIRKWNHSRSTLVLGVPGDRSDDMICLSGTAAAECFSKIIIREDDDLRGRTSGEVAALLKGTVYSQNPQIPARIILDNRESLETAIFEMEENEIVVYLYEDIKLAESIIREREGKILHDFSRFIPIERNQNETVVWQ